MKIWSEEHDAYLHKMSIACKSLSSKYLDMHNKYKNLNYKYTLPMLLLGSVVGMLTFGMDNFEGVIRDSIKYSVGGINILIGFVSSVQATMKVPDVLTESLQVSNAFTKMAEQIDLELRLPINERKMDGVEYIREHHAEFLKIMEDMPVLKRRIWTDVDRIVNEIPTTTRTSIVIPPLSKSREIVFSDDDDDNLTISKPVADHV